MWRKENREHAPARKRTTPAAVSTRGGRGCGSGSGASGRPLVIVAHCCVFCWRSLSGAEKAKAKSRRDAGATETGHDYISALRESCSALRAICYGANYARNQTFGVLALQRNGVRRDAANFVPEVQGRVLRSLRSDATARGWRARRRRPGRGDFAVARHVALSLGASDRRASHAR